MVNPRGFAARSIVRLFRPEQRALHDAARGARACMAAAALLWPMAIGSAATGAELKGFVYPCEEKMCFWHKAVFAPPKGWREDEAWTRRYKAAVLFPESGASRSDPMIYVRAHVGQRDLDIADYVRGAQERWKQERPDSTIEPQPDVVRPGKPTLKVFLYRNPSTPDQAFELTAFTKDNNTAPNTNPADMYFFQAVLIAPSMRALEKAKPAFLDILGRL